MSLEYTLNHHPFGYLMTRSKNVGSWLFTDRPMWGDLSLPEFERNLDQPGKYSLFLTDEELIDWIRTKRILEIGPGQHAKAMQEMINKGKELGVETDIKAIEPTLQATYTDEFINDYVNLGLFDKIYPQYADAAFEAVGEGSIDVAYAIGPNFAQHAPDAVALLKSFIGIAKCLSPDGFMLFEVLMDTDTQEAYVKLDKNNHAKESRIILSRLLKDEGIGYGLKMDNRKGALRIHNSNLLVAKLTVFVNNPDKLARYVINLN